MHQSPSSLQTRLAPWQHPPLTLPPHPRSSHKACTKLTTTTLREQAPVAVEAAAVWRTLALTSGGRHSGHSAGTSSIRALRPSGYSTLCSRVIAPRAWFSRRRSQQQQQQQHHHHQRKSRCQAATSSRQSRRTTSVVVTHRSVVVVAPLQGAEAPRQMGEQRRPWSLRRELGALDASAGAWSASLDEDLCKSNHLGMRPFPPATPPQLPSLSSCHPSRAAARAAYCIGMAMAIATTCGECLRGSSGSSRTWRRCFS